MGNERISGNLRTSGMPSIPGIPGILRHLRRPPRSRFPFLISPPARRSGARLRLEKQPAEPLGSFFSGLLPIVDGLEAVRALISQTGEEQWRRGISMFSEKLLEHLAAFGLQATAQVGEPFDPTVHEALAAAEDRGVGEGCVCEVVQQGWRYGGKLLRFARVVVARAGKPGGA